jgi:phospholipid transport system substrate-binding protein
MLRRIQFGIPRALGAAVLLAASLATSPGNARVDDPGSFIQNLGNDANRVLGPGVPENQRIAHFRTLFDRDFDLHDAARFVLGPNARVLTPEQNREFLTLFREFLAQAYSKKLGEYGGEPLRVTGNRPYGGETIVTSRVIRRSGAPIEMDWHVIDRDGRWLITDVYVDGVSMRASQRQEFASIIQRNGGRPDALLAVLRQQLGQDQAVSPHVGSSTPPAAAQPMPGSQAPLGGDSTPEPMPAPQPSR